MHFTFRGIGEVFTDTSSRSGHYELSCRFLTAEQCTYRLCLKVTKTPPTASQEHLSATYDDFNIAFTTIIPNLPPEIHRCSDFVDSAAGLGVMQGGASEPTSLSNVCLEGTLLTAELGGQLYKATVVSHTYLDEQVPLSIEVCIWGVGLAQLCKCIHGVLCA